LSKSPRALVFYHITATKCYVFQDLKLKSSSMQIHSADCCKIFLKLERHFSNHISISPQPVFIAEHFVSFFSFVTFMLGGISSCVGL